MIPQLTGVTDVDSILSMIPQLTGVTDVDSILSTPSTSADGRDRSRFDLVHDAPHVAEEGVRPRRARVVPRRRARRARALQRVSRSGLRRAPSRQRPRTSTFVRTRRIAMLQSRAPAT